MFELGTIEQWQRLARVKNKGHAGFRKLIRMLQHRLTAIRCDDSKRYPNVRSKHISHMQLIGTHHRPRVEGGDLVIVQIGGDKSLCSVAIVQLQHMCERDSERLEAGAIRREVGTHRSKWQWRATKHVQIIRNITRHATKVFAHFWHEKRHIQHMHFVRQNVILEVVLKHHQGVIGKGAANKC